MLLGVVRRAIGCLKGRPAHHPRLHPARRMGRASPRCEPVAATSPRPMQTGGATCNPLTLLSPRDRPSGCLCRPCMVTVGVSPHWGSMAGFTHSAGCAIRRSILMRRCTRPQRRRGPGLPPCSIPASILGRRRDPMVLSMSLVPRSLMVWRPTFPSRSAGLHAPLFQQNTLGGVQYGGQMAVSIWWAGQMGTLDYPR
jgi:hypothetical protein